MELDLDRIVSVLSSVKDLLPENLGDILKTAASALPSQIDIGASLKFIIIFVAALLGLGVVFKLIFGRKSDLNHAMSSAAGILVVYVLTVISCCLPYPLRPLCRIIFLSCPSRALPLKPCAARFSP